MRSWERQCAGATTRSALNKCAPSWPPNLPFPPKLIAHSQQTGNNLHIVWLHLPLFIALVSSGRDGRFVSRLGVTIITIITQLQTYLSARTTLTSLIEASNYQHKQVAQDTQQQICVEHSNKQTNWRIKIQEPT